MFGRPWEELAAEAGYRPGKLAELCGVSLRTLQRHFAANYNCTLSAWLKKIRLRTAYSRIHEGEAVKVVAYDLGFKQLSHFSRVFKQAHGVPPSMLFTATHSRSHQLETLSGPSAAFISQ
jgi:AraC-like DNA-binding protein